MATEKRWERKAGKKHALPPHVGERSLSCLRLSVLAAEQGMGTGTAAAPVPNTGNPAPEALLAPNSPCQHLSCQKLETQFKMQIKGNYVSYRKFPATPHCSNRCGLRTGWAKKGKETPQNKETHSTQFSFRSVRQTWSDWSTVSIEVSFAVYNGQHYSPFVLSFLLKFKVKLNLLLLAACICLEYFNMICCGGNTIYPAQFNEMDHKTVTQN